MTTQPTQDAVPSESPRDLKFNAGKIDEFVTSMGWTYTDRMGVKHYTIEGINYLAQQAMNAFGYVILTGKTFATGATINNPNEVLLNTADGEYYKWTGSFASGPKVVPASSTPAGTGGIGPGAWIGVGDASLRTALAALTGAGLVGLSVGTTYPPNTVGSAIQYRTPQMYGVEPSATNAIGSGLDAMFAAGGEIRFEKPGVYLTSKTWVLRSGTRLYIGPGVIIRLANQSNVNIFQNFAYNTSATTADDNIEIWGPGTIDFNGTNQTTGGLSSMATILKNITNLKIGGGIKVINANKYAWLVCKITNFTADGLLFDTLSDGLHCQPPIRHSYIRNLKGKTGDDMLAFTIGDYAQYNISEAGDFSNVDVEGLFCESALCALKITGNNTGVFVRFRVSGIYGNTTGAVVRIWGDTNLTYTKVNHLTIEDVFAVPGAAIPTVEINDRGFGNSGSTYSVEIDTLRIARIYTPNAAAQTVYISGTFGTRIRDLDFSNPPRDALALVGLNNATTVQVDKLSIRSGNVNLVSDANASIVLNRGILTKLSISDMYVVFSDAANGNLVRLIGACTIGNASITDVYQKNGARGWNHVNAPANTPIVNFTNYIIDAGSRIAQTTGSNLIVRLKNCAAINIGTANMFFAAGGTLTLSGDIDNSVNNIGLNSGGIVTCPPGMHGIMLNVDLLTSQDGASVHNLNAALSCGAGRVLVQSKTWKHLYSGATYTSSI